MEGFDISAIVVAVLTTVVSIGLGIMSKKYGDKYKAIKTKMDDIASLIAYATKALDDDKLSKEESEEILRRIKELI